MKAFELKQPDGSGYATMCTSKKAAGWYVEVYLHTIERSLGKGPFASEELADAEAEVMARAAANAMKCVIHELTPEEINAAVKVAIDHKATTN